MGECTGKGICMSILFILLFPFSWIVSGFCAGIYTSCHCWAAWPCLTCLEGCFAWLYRGLDLPWACMKNIWAGFGCGSEVPCCCF